jgi:hypothetical protein
MREVPLATGVGIAVLAYASLALAQTDCSALMPASPWGPTIRRARPIASAGGDQGGGGGIQSGDVIAMSYPLTDGIPLFGTRFTKTILTATTLAPGAALSGTRRPTWRTPGSARATWGPT